LDERTHRVMFVPGIERMLQERRVAAEAVMDHIEPGTELIVGVANAEPVTVIDAIEAAADRLRRVRLHRMLPLRDRRCIAGEVPGLHHVSWFLSPHDKDAFQRRTLRPHPEQLQRRPEPDAPPPRPAAGADEATDRDRAPEFPRRARAQRARARIPVAARR
jgi:hypothetical protein